MTNNKYFLYVRKSTDTEDKQIQSLEDQIRVMKKKALDYGIKIIDTFTESMSAKAPGRYKFNEMIQRINNGEAKGIISWKIDRLTRNPIDTGTIQYMLQKGKIEKIITNDREYNTVDAGLLMSVETGMANQFILDLSKNVKRGMDSKYLKGVRPTRVPLGYLNINNNGEKSIDIDEDRFELVRKMWDLMLTGNYSPNKINTILSEEYGLRTRKTKKSGGNEVSNSGTYRAFHNIFYTGYYYHNGELIKGKHKAMISLTEFDRVQELLGKKGNPRAKSYDFPFTGMIKCGECGCSITAENKRKYIKSTGETRIYTYYHCTKKRKKMKCTQKTIRNTELEKQVLKVLSEIEIMPEFKTFALEIIKEEYDNNIDLKIKQSESIDKAIIGEEKQLKKLTDVLLKELITDDEYGEKKQELYKKIEKLKQERKNIDMKGKIVLDYTLNAFEFVCKAKESFRIGDLETKKNILSTLGKNLILKDRKVLIELNPWFQVIRNRLSNLEGGLQRLESTKKGISKVNTETFNKNSSIWFGI